MKRYEILTGKEKGMIVEAEEKMYSFGLYGSNGKKLGISFRGICCTATFAKYNSKGKLNYKEV